jgi:hypothetical protein
MALPLQELLERRFGVDEETFAATLREFADRAGPLAVTDIRPQDALGAAQQTALRTLGASLQPLQPGELGPIAGLAAAHAELAARSLTVAEVARRLGVDTSRVRQRIRGRSLYAFKHRGAWRVPAFQIEGRALVSGLDAVVSALPQTLHPVAVSRWFTTPCVDLLLGDMPVSPIAWLSSGGPPAPVGSLAADLDQG